MRSDVRADDDKDSRSNAHVKSASRVFDILELLAKAPEGLTFSSLNTRLGLPKSSLHALLHVMVSRGYVAFEQQQRTYHLGIRVWEAGQAYLHHRDLLREARPVMDQIVGQINETVQLAVLDGIENVYLAKVDCSHPVRLQSEVGRRLFAHATGLGKVLLAHLPDQEREARLAGVPLPCFTPNTVTDPQRLRVELTKARATGFAVDDQEYTPGLRCVAVPIYDHQGQVIAALSASIPLMRANPFQLATALRAVAVGSLAISRRLGSSTDDPRLVAIARRQSNERDPLVALIESRLQGGTTKGGDAGTNAISEVVAQGISL